MGTVFVVIMAATVALVVTMVTFPMVLRFAKRKGIVDNPSARKLQRTPVPVMGGAVVYLGMLAGGLVLVGYMPTPMLQWGLLAMTVMLAIGVWDDIKDISAVLRLMIEVVMVWSLMAMTDMYIDDFHGFWGVHGLSPYVALPLSLVAGVGIINAVNLIDGVDGYASGYGMMACGCFALLFGVSGKPAMACLAVVMAASLVPFFLHNVFGVRSKMFIGDGGTLMLGMLMTVFVFSALSSLSECRWLEHRQVGLLAFTLAVLCIPVFDTLRVMTARIARGASPLRPDKTHLHHLFIDMGFSHLGAAMVILAINMAVVMAWGLLWWMGASIDVQTYAVVAMGTLVTFVFYPVMKGQKRGGELDKDGNPTGTKLWRGWQRLGRWSHGERKWGWRLMRSMMDWKY